MGPTQPPAGFVVMPVLQDTMVRILSYLEGMSHERALPSTPSGSEVRGEAHISAQEALQGVRGLGVQPAAAALHLEILPVLVRVVKAAKHQVRLYGVHTLGIRAAVASLV
ncbi:hypothetical protein HAX54_044799 [Datura stramonium]|uniref:Uncharacterized protein n=1 Tax=Datura stramonium TaxID=4076 RepID=A0ABS8WHI2_DATST|nr:hypothetical protein [Datura stramonium]